MNENEKMLAGKLYDPSCDGLDVKRAKAHALCTEYNATFETETEKRAAILKELLPNAASGCYVQGPIFCDYGEYLYIGENFYANFNFTALDCAPIRIGKNAFFGPNVTIVTPVHPFRWQDRNMRKKPNGAPYDLEYAKPIEIGDNCWLASNVVVIGGVKIGNGCVIGAGSVVTRDIPDNSLAVGNPARVVRKITDADAVELKKELY